LRLSSPKSIPISLKLAVSYLTLLALQGSKTLYYLI
jgi:hypothetical protein